MFEYVGKRHKEPIMLSVPEMKLLSLIGKLGFVNKNQLNMLWSLCKRYPVCFAPSILSKWSQFGALIKVSKKPISKNSKNAVTRTTYSLTTNGRSFLIDNKVWPADYDEQPDISVNSHNEQAIEALVQGLYAAMFKYRSLGGTIPLLELQKDSRLPSKLPLYSSMLLHQEVYSDNASLQQTLYSRDADGAASPHSSEGTVPLTQNKQYTVGKSDGIKAAEEQYADTIVPPIRRQITTVLGGTVHPVDRTVPTNRRSRQQPITNAGKEFDAAKYPTSLIRPTNKLTTEAVNCLLVEGYITPLLISGQDTRLLFHRVLMSLLPNYTTIPITRSLSCIVNTDSLLRTYIPYYLLLSNRQALLIALLKAWQAIPLTRSFTPEGKTEAFQTAPVRGRSFSLGLSVDLSYRQAAAVVGYYYLSGDGGHNVLGYPRGVYGRISAALVQLRKQRQKLTSAHLVDTQGDDDLFSSHDQKLSAGDEVPLGRSLDLISNPAFHLEDYDLSSFNYQFGNQFGNKNDLPFIADLMVSFIRNKRKQELFIELDNRTETNETQIQKVINYIWYALTHPNRDIEMLVVTTDGSLSSKRLKNYTNVSRRLGNLATRLSHGFIDTDQGKLYIRDLLKQASNLHVALTGVSEAHIDIAQFLLGSNYFTDYQESIEGLIDFVNHNSEWHAQFIPNDAFKYIDGTPELKHLPTGLIKEKFYNHKSKGLRRYLPKNICMAKEPPTWGWIEFKHQRSNTTYQQPVYFGQEHELDSLLDVYELSGQAVETLGRNYPIVFYPKRERKVSALSLPEFTDMLTWSDFYSFNQLLYVQPLYGLTDNFQLRCELRWLLQQYSNDVYNYYQTGYLNKAAQKARVQFSSDTPSPLTTSCRLIDCNITSLCRQFTTLQALAKKEKKAVFVSQLNLYEAPIDLYRVLIRRWPQGAYSLPAIVSLPYWNNQLETMANRVKKQYSFQEFLHCPNSTTIKSRISPQF